MKSKVLHFEFIHPDQFLVAQSGFIVQRIATDGTILKTYQGHQGPVTAIAIEFVQGKPM